MKDSLAKQVVEIVKILMKLEATTTAGRINILGMLLSVILAISLSLAPLFETLVRLFHPSEDVGAPLLQIFVAFIIFTLICAGMLGYLEGPRDRRDASPPASTEQPGHPGEAPSPDSVSPESQEAAT